MDNKKKNTATVAGVVFVGCMLIGLGLGMLYHKSAIGIMLGLGVGFVAMGLIWAFLGKNDSAGKD